MTFTVTQDTKICHFTVSQMQK